MGTLVTFEEFQARRFPSEVILDDKGSALPTASFDNLDYYVDALENIKAEGGAIMPKLINVLLIIATHDKNQKVTVTSHVYKILTRLGLPKKKVVSLGIDEPGIERIAISKEDLEVLVNII